MQNLTQLKKDLRKKADPKRTKAQMRFFKTGKGEYGEGDVFIGVKLLYARALVKKYKDLPLNKIERLLYSKIHEERGVGLGILVYQFEKGDEKVKKQIYNFYRKHRRRVNSWDLVDGSAPKIIGAYLMDRPKDILYKYAKSTNLWERRISVLATAFFIKNDKYNETLKISKILLNDKHDLIHKGAGWMLREVGNRDRKVEEKFLKKHYKKMPRTMLRYAIEKFPETLRQKYLKGKV